MLTKEFPSLVRSVSCTTRAPRPGEEEGRDYFFLSKREFQEKVQQEAFLEHAEVFDELYGTTQEFVTSKLKLGKDVVLVIDTQGALQIQKKDIPATYIFITAPSMKELKARMEKRHTEDQQHMQQRLIWAKHEIEMLSHYDYHIVNDKLEEAYNVLKSIFVAEKHKIRR